MQQISDFLEKATTAFGTVEQAKRELLKAGYQQLKETERWQIEPGNNYFVERNGSSLVAFQLPDRKPEDMKGFRIICAHTDSPCFKIKEKPLMQAGKVYWKLNVERYGGMIEESWFDRPLSIAGRVVVKTKSSPAEDAGDALVSIPVDFVKPVCMIPSLAIHMRRGEDTQKINPQLHLLPMIGAQGKEEPDFMQILADRINQTKTTECAIVRRVAKEDILGMDLYTYVCQKPVCVGFQDEFIMAPRLDDLLCVYCGLEAITGAKATAYINVLGMFDNEEVGSKTMQGADSDFLRTVLGRIVKNLAPDNADEMYERMLAAGFLLSADNAHALHPNYMEKADPTNQPVLGGGVVLKFHAGQKYTTSGYTGAYVKMLGERADVPVQTYHNRSDIAGGSTLGNLALAHVSVPAADIGVGQLAMHSAYETAAVKDIEAMSRLMKEFYV